jgi:hypothetical protein
MELYYLYGQEKLHHLSFFWKNHDIFNGVILNMLFLVIFYLLVFLFFVILYCPHVTALSVLLV